MRIFFCVFATIVLVFLFVWLDVISFNAAEITVKDIDAKVIYHYDDGYDFVGYNERAKVNFKDSYIHFSNDYTRKLSKYKSKFIGCGLEFNLNDIEIQRTGDNDILDLCINQTKLEVLKKRDKGFFKDQVFFEYEGKLDVYLNTPDTTKLFVKYPRTFNMKAEFIIDGIYDADFLEYQMAQIVVLKLKTVVYDYLLQYHGVKGIHGWYMRFSNKFLQAES